MCIRSAAWTFLVGPPVSRIESPGVSTFSTSQRWFILVFPVVHFLISCYSPCWLGYWFCGWRFALIFVGFYCSPNWRRISSLADLCVILVKYDYYSLKPNLNGYLSLRLKMSPRSTQVLIFTSFCFFHGWNYFSRICRNTGKRSVVLSDVSEWRSISANSLSSFGGIFFAGDQT